VLIPVGIVSAIFEWNRKVKSLVQSKQDKPELPAP
jgi:hypothetical protein